MKEKNGGKNSIFLVSLFLIILIVFFMYLFFIKPNNDIEKYSITFYNNDSYIDTVYLNKGTTISNEKLEEIEEKLDIFVDDNMICVWSTKKDELDSVNFDELNYNQTVYLFIIKNNYDIYINPPELFNYELLNKDKIQYGDTIEFIICSTIELDNFYIEIEINGEMVNVNSENKYTVENVQEDIYINILMKEEVFIIPMVEEFQYDDKVHYAEYELLNNNGEILTSNDVEISYFMNDIEVEGMKDIGTYVVIFKYIGDKYYVKDEIKVNYIVTKRIPLLDIIEKEFLYNGEYQSYTLEDIVTDSDGNITFINNSNKNVGIYEVIIKISETKYYSSKEIKVSQIIKKGIPLVDDWPYALNGFEGHILKTVDIIGGNADIDGEFIWTFETEKLENGKKLYSISFVPTDSQYETLFKDILVETITIEESLRRIRVEKEALYEKYKEILKDNIYQIDNLSTTGDIYPIEITWFSSSTILMVNSKTGYVDILSKEGNYKVELIAIITYGDTAEYISFSFILNVSD